MRFENLPFGFIHIDGSEYVHDIVLDRDEIRWRKKKPATSSVTRCFLSREKSRGMQSARDRHRSLRQITGDAGKCVMGET